MPTALTVATIFKRLNPYSQTLLPHFPSMFQTCSETWPLLPLSLSKSVFHTEACRSILKLMIDVNINKQVHKPPVILFSALGSCDKIQTSWRPTMCYVVWLIPLLSQLKQGFLLVYLLFSSVMSAFFPDHKLPPSSRAFASPASFS